jgi:hypothetical protein
VDMPSLVMLSSAVVIFMKDIYLEELLKETCILYFFNIGSYVWSVGI